MIKEKPKKTKYNAKKTRNQIISEYLRTVLFSVFTACIITAILSVHARNEMIKNLYENPAAQRKIDKQLAMQFINSNSDLLDDLRTKKYSVIMNVGSLYETAEDYQTAQVAYEFAKEKAKPDNYTSHYKLICMYLYQGKFKEAEAVVNEVKDYTSKNLFKFKTRSYIVIGDKYYSIGKFLSAAKNYEKAKFYYDKFTKKKDEKIEESIQTRIRNAYIHTADELVKMNKIADAYRFLKKVEKMTPDDLKIKYKLAIILSDLDPEESVKYLEYLLKKAPQDVDYDIYGRALMKSANIADLDGRPTQAKYYRYKIHSIDMFINRKVIYKNDVNVILDPTPVKKGFFTYPIKLKYKFLNNSNTDLVHIYGDFVLTDGENPLETYEAVISGKDKPLYSGSSEPNEVAVKFRRKVFTKKELAAYTVKIYLYKDEKFKTLVAETRIPLK